MELQPERRRLIKFMMVQRQKIYIHKDKRDLMTVIQELENKLSEKSKEKVEVETFLE